MKKLLLLLAAVILIAPILLAESAPVEDVKINKTGNTKPAVTFNHPGHAAKIGSKAEECDACHNAVKSKDSAHKYCAECHKTMKSGPVLAKCNTCHKPVK